MSPRQLLFLGGVALISLLAAVFTGPMVLDALLDAPEPTEPPAEAPSAQPHPEAAP